MRVQKCIEVNGHQIPDFRLSLGGQLICEVDLYAGIYGMFVSKLWVLLFVADKHVSSEDAPL